MVLHSSTLIGAITIDLIIAFFKATQVYQFQVNAVLIVNFKPYFTNHYSNFTDNDLSINTVKLHFLHNKPFILLVVSYTKIYVLNKKTNKTEQNHKQTEGIFSCP